MATIDDLFKGLSPALGAPAQILHGTVLSEQFIASG
jgi:hypothetical protein